MCVIYIRVRVCLSNLQYTNESAIECVGVCVCVYGREREVVCVCVLRVFLCESIVSITFQKHAATYTYVCKVICQVSMHFT